MIRRDSRAAGDQLPLALVRQLGSARRGHRGLRWALVLGLAVLTGGGAPFFVAAAALAASPKGAPKVSLLVDGDLDDSVLSRRPNRDRRRRRRTLSTTAVSQLRTSEKGTRTLAAGPPGFWGPDFLALVDSPAPPGVVESVVLLPDLSRSAHLPAARRLYLRHCSLLI